MLIFGSPIIRSEAFYGVNSKEEIAKTPPNSTIYMEFSRSTLLLIDYAISSQITLALKAKSLLDVIYCANIGSTYIIVEEDLAKKAQEVAQNYLFDAKIVVEICSESQIEEFALQGIDGVIFDDAIIRSQN